MELIELRVSTKNIIRATACLYFERPLIMKNIFVFIAVIVIGKK